MTALMALIIALTGGVAGGLTAIWATRPAAEGEAVGQRGRHARAVIAARRADRRRRGIHDPYRGGYQPRHATPQAREEATSNAHPTTPLPAGPAA